MSRNRWDMERGKIYIALHISNSLFSSIVKSTTRSCYSHVSLVLRSGEIIEANRKHGVRLLPALVAEDTELIEIYSVEMTEEQADQIERFVRRQLGKKYDWHSILRFLSPRFSALLGITRKRHCWFCGCLVFTAFRYARINLLERIQSWQIYPGKLRISPLLVYQHTIGA